MDEHSNQEKGVIELVDCIILPVMQMDIRDPSEGPFCFEISSVFPNSHNRSTYRLRCDSEHDLIEWLFAIRESVTIKASTWVVKQVNSPPQLIGILVVTLKSGQRFNARHGYNILLSLDNQFARQQKIASSQSGSHCPVWDEYYSFAIWNSESRLVVRLAVRKRQGTIMRSNYRSKIKGIHSFSLEDIFRIEGGVSKWIELHSLGSQGLMDSSIQARKGVHRTQQSVLTELEGSGNPAVNIQVQFLSLDTILYQVLDRYQDMFTNIMDDKNALIVLCNHAVILKENEVFSTIIHVFLQNRKVLSLLQWLIREEVEKCSDSNTLFRTDNIVTKLMSSFCRLVGACYRRKVLENFVKGVCESPFKYELDPDKISTGESIEENTHNVFHKTEEVVMQIINQPAEIPLSFIVICKILYDEVSRKFEEDSAYKALSGFLFLRFLCPGLVSPVLIYEDDPLLLPKEFLNISPEARRALVILGKVVQSLANEVGFGVKERYLERLEPLLVNLRAPMREFYNSLTLKSNGRSSTSRPRLLTHDYNMAIRSYESIRNSSTMSSSLSTGDFDFQLLLQRADFDLDPSLLSLRQLTADAVQLHRFLLQHPIPDDLQLLYSVTEPLGLVSVEEMKAHGIRAWSRVIDGLRQNGTEEAIRMSHLVTSQVSLPHPPHQEARGPQPFAAAQETNTAALSAATHDHCERQTLITVMRVLNPTDPLYILPKMAARK